MAGIVMPGAFVLPIKTSNFPADANSIPVCGVEDSGGYITLPSSMWIKNASNLWVPVSASDPVPTEVSGSSIAKTSAVPVIEVSQVPTIDTLLNAVSVTAGAFTEFNITPTTEKEIWLAISVDKQPWAVYMSGPFYGGTDGGEEALFPKRMAQTSTPTALSPALSICLGADINTASGLTYPTTLSEAKQTLMPYVASLKGRILNGHATDTATVTIKAIRVWR